MMVLSPSNCQDLSADQCKGNVSSRQTPNNPASCQLCVDPADDHWLITHTLNMLHYVWILYLSSPQRIVCEGHCTAVCRAFLSSVGCFSKRTWISFLPTEAFVNVLCGLIFSQRRWRCCECWKVAPGSQPEPVHRGLHRHSEGVSDSIHAGCTLVCCHARGSAAADSWQQSGWEAARHHWGWWFCLQESRRVRVLLSSHCLPLCLQCSRTLLLMCSWPGKCTTEDTEYFSGLSL